MTFTNKINKLFIFWSIEKELGIKKMIKSKHFIKLTPLPFRETGDARSSKKAPAVSIPAMIR